MVAGQGSEVNKSFVSPTQSEGEAPRTHSLTPSLSVCTFLHTPQAVVCLFNNVFLDLLVESSVNVFPFVFHIDQDVTLALLSIYSKHCLQYWSIPLSV